MNRRAVGWSESAFNWSISEGLSERVMSEKNDLDISIVRKNRWSMTYLHEEPCGQK